MTGNGSDPPRWMKHSLNMMTWAEFLKCAEEHGVQLVETTDAIGESGKRGKYLLRIVEDEDHWAQLPSDFNPNDKIGPFRFESICRRLKLHPHTHFPGWPLIL